MIPTFVFGWPTGKEIGDFLAVDLGMTSCMSSHYLIYSPKPYSGGTNLRVCLVTLQGDGKFEITQSKYRLTEEQKQEDGQKLFDFCAQCLKTFITTNFEEGTIKEGELLPLGFTVSSVAFTVFTLALEAPHSLIRSRSTCPEYAHVCSLFRCAIHAVMFILPRCLVLCSRAC